MVGGWANKKKGPFGDAEERSMDGEGLEMEGHGPRSQAERKHMECHLNP